MTTLAPRKEELAVGMKVSLRCGGSTERGICDKKLATVPIDLLDKGIEIVCPRCGYRNIFD